MKRYATAMFAMMILALTHATSASAYEDCGRFKPGSIDQAKCLTRVNIELTRDMAALQAKVIALEARPSGGLQRGDTVTIGNHEGNMNRDMCLADGWSGLGLNACNGGDLHLQWTLR